VEQELIGLATEAAKITIEAATKLAPALWQQTKQRILALWSKPDDPAAAEARAAADRLDDPQSATADGSAPWAIRYAALLQARPESADELRTLIGDITKQTHQTSTRGNVFASMLRTWFSSQVVLAGDGNTYVKSGAVGIGASALLVMIAALVGYLVLRPDARIDGFPKPAASSPGTTSAPAARGDSCGDGLPAVTEPATGADDPTVRQSYTYKVGSASGDGRNIEPGGSIRQAFVAGRAYLSQVSAIIGVANSRPHPIEFRVQRLDGTVLMTATENEVPANNNKDVVHNLAHPVRVTPREVLFLSVTNRSSEQIRFFVDPPISNEAPAPYPACITGQATSPDRHADLRGNILAGSVTGQDVP
jgi:hypothetical protein